MQSTSLTCICTHCRALLVPTAILHLHLLRVYRHYCWLHLYALFVCSQDCRPAWVRRAEPRWYPLQSFIRTRCSSALYIIDLHLLAELLWYPLLSYIRTRCLYAVNIADLCSCVAEPHWYLLLSYIRTCCSYALNSADLRSNVLQGLAGSTAVLHSHLLHLCCHYRWLHPYALLICHLHC